MPSIADRVKETTTTTGTGAVSLGGATAGFRAFSSAFTSGTEVYYCITDGTNWEVGYGAVTTGTPWTLARSTVLASSNAGALVSFGAGTKDVFNVMPAVALETASLTVAQETHAATSKTTPVDADELPIADSAAAFVLKKLTWANLKATLKTYMDTLYPSRTAVTGSVVLPAGTTAQRDASPTAGYVRFNSTLNQYEGGNGAAWTNLGGAASKILPIAASVASNALTITLNPTVLDFRSATLGSGAVNTRMVDSAISLVISSGSTLGATNAIQSRIVVIAIDNAGVVELAAVNIAGGNNLDETTLISTTAEGGIGGADSASVIYSATARTSLPFRIVGYVESTQATAGTWVTAPSTIQGYGGQALAAMSSFGFGQTKQVVARTGGTTYYNTTNKAIQVSVEAFRSTPSGNFSAAITNNGIVQSSGLYVSTVGGNNYCFVSDVILPGSPYLITVAGHDSYSVTEIR